jgi:hypothetical protein
MPSRRVQQLNIHVLSPCCGFNIQRTCACACADEGHFDSLYVFDLVFHCAQQLLHSCSELILKRGSVPFLLPYQIVRNKRKVSLKIFKVNVVKIDTR